MRTTPREAAATIVREWLGLGGSDALAAPPSLPLADFQRDAVNRATAILPVRHGVLIADSVGLGKTHIALALIDRAVYQQQRVLVVVPAQLIGTWRRHLRRLAYSANCTSWSLRGPREGEAGPPRIALLTHARLSTGNYPEKLRGVELVVVDESHAFRNRQTRRYCGLAELCRGAQVVLLSATPVNNALADLYAQIRLFARDHDFRDLGVADLRTAFDAAAGAPGASASLQRVIAAVTIRRTHEQIAHRTDFTIPALVTDTVRYDAESDGDALKELLSILSALRFVPLCIGEYRLGAGVHGGGTAAELLRLHLLKRMESSHAAFAASLQRLARLNRAFIDELDAGRLLSPAAFRELVEASSARVDQRILSELVLPMVAIAGRVDAAARDAAGDLELLARARTVLGRHAHDAKLAALLALLDRHAGEPVLLFTEFRETARYLHGALQRRRRVGLIDGRNARLGNGLTSRERVLRAFTKPGKPRETVDLLIATDVLSEGLDLQAAKLVISYDLPWNPVRLMQRIGRARRIGSPHDVVNAFSFLPDAGLEPMLGLLRRVERKLATIRATVGTEAELRPTALHPDASFIERLATGGTAPSMSFAWSDPLTVTERLRAAVASSEAAAARSATHGVDDAPHCAVAAGPCDGVLAAFRTGAGLRVGWLADDGAFEEDVATVGPLLELALDARDLSGIAIDLTRTLARTTAALQAHDRAALLGNRRVSPSARRAAAVLLRTLETERLDGPRIARAERLLAYLRMPLLPTTEGALTAALDALPDPPPLVTLLRTLEPVLRSDPAQPLAVHTPELLALIRFCQTAEHVLPVAGSVDRALQSG